MIHSDTTTSHTPTPEKPSASSSKLHNDKSASKAAGRWTKEEHQRFIDGLKMFGKNWKQVEEHVSTRNGAQIRSHAQKFFNRLEREFNMKFDDLNRHSDKKKLEEMLKKMADSPIDTTASSSRDDETREIKISSNIPKELSPIPETPYKFDPNSQISIPPTALSLSNSPKLDHFEYPSYQKRARKMSEDILHSRSNSMFDVIMSKIRTCNNRVTSPRLSDLVDITSSSRSSFDLTNVKPNPIKPIPENEHFLNSSFRLHPRKMSEDNVLINTKLSQLRRPDDLSDLELLTKKFKAN